MFNLTLNSHTYPAQALVCTPEKFFRLAFLSLFQAYLTNKIHKLTCPKVHQSKRGTLPHSLSLFLHRHGRTQHPCNFNPDDERSTEQYYFSHQDIAIISIPCHCQ